eukprot:764046-Hanusia_phi.AAC.1
MLGFVDFGRMTGRKEVSSDADLVKLGPGVYEVRDHLLFKNCLQVTFGRQERFLDDKSHEDEGDRLVLYPEKAESLVRPNIPNFSFIFQHSALDSEWARKKICVREHNGELLELPSIRTRLKMKQLSELVAIWRRPDFYELKETLTRKTCFQKSLVDISRSSNSRKLDLGMKLDFDDKISASLPCVKQITKDGLVDRAGSIQKGDKIVKVVAKDGTTMDLQRWATRPTRQTARSKLPSDTSNQINLLGPWRECVDSAGAGAGAGERAEMRGAKSFFYNVETREKNWSFEWWSRRDEILVFIMQSIQDMKFPITIHFRRHQSHCTFQVQVEDFQDFRFGAYNPKFELVEHDLNSVPDFVTANGRDLSLDGKARIRLLQKTMTLNSLKALPSHISASPAAAVEADFTSKKLILRERHAKLFRELRERHRKEAAEVEDDEAGDLKIRHSQERKELRKRIRREEEELTRTFKEHQIIPSDKSEVEDKVSKLVHKQRLELDVGERLRETERQRRVRFAPDNEALLHTATYSSAAPADKKWVVTGKSHSNSDVRGLSEREVQDWRLHTEYRGFSESDNVVKWFWQLMESWSPRRRAETLQLATGTAAAPRGGFGCLFGHDIKRSDRPIPFSIRRLEGGDSRRQKTLKAFPPLNRLYLPE